MARSRKLNVFLFVLVISVLAIPLATTANVAAASREHASVVAAQVGSAPGTASAASEGLPLLGLGTALILGASLMRRLALTRMK